MSSENPDARFLIEIPAQQETRESASKNRKLRCIRRGRRVSRESHLRKSRRIRALNATCPGHAHNISSQPSSISKYSPELQTSRRQELLRNCCFVKSYFSRDLIIKFFSVTTAGVIRFRSHFALR